MIGEQLVCKREVRNAQNTYAVAVIRRGAQWSAMYACVRPCMRAYISPNRQIKTTVKISRYTVFKTSNFILQKKNC